jgi:hypothetical protein
MKEEVTYDMENLRQKNETGKQNTMEGHSRRLEEAEDRISELKDKMEMKEKTKELLKEYARTHQLHQKNKPENQGH